MNRRNALKVIAAAAVAPAVIPKEKKPRLYVLQKDVTFHSCAVTGIPADQMCVVVAKGRAMGKTEQLRLSYEVRRLEFSEEGRLVALGPVNEDNPLNRAIQAKL